MARFAPKAGMEKYLALSIIPPHSLNIARELIVATKSSWTPPFSSKAWRCEATPSCFLLQPRDEEVHFTPRDSSPMKALLKFFIAVVFFNPGAVFAACAEGKAETTPSSRFTLNGAEVFDQKTNLTWRRCSVGATWKSGKCVGAVKLMSLNEARDYAQKQGGGWRVPTIEELHGIVEQTCRSPAINSEIFPDVTDLGEGAPYWSVTRIKEMPSLTYYVDFIDGSTDGHTKGFSMAVRLVRSGKQDQI